MACNVTIRVAQETDVAFTNWVKMWNDVGVTSDSLISECRSKTLDFCKHAQKELDFKLFVAQTPDGAVVGSACCQVWAGPQPCAQTLTKIGTMWAVYVEQSYRRRGIATKLVEHCIQHWKTLGCTEAVLIYASEEGKRVYKRLGFAPGRLLACDIPIEEADAQVVHGEPSKYSISKVQDESYDLLLAKNYRNALLSSGYEAERLLYANVIPDTLDFIQNARLGLDFCAFVATNNAGEVVASVCSQVWDGPLPCIVEGKTLKFGSMWGLYLRQDSIEVAKELVDASVEHLKFIGCHKILTLCPNPQTQNILSSACSFSHSNALVLELMPRHNVPNESQTHARLTPGVKQSMVDALRSKHKHFTSMTDVQLCWLLTSNQNQLNALDYSDEIKSAVVQVQKAWELYMDPNDNWFTQNVHRLGKGFDLEKLSSDPQALAQKFDKLAHNYDAWTLGNQSRIESWVAEKSKLLLAETASDTTHVLDMCCGTGLQGHMLRLCGFRGVLSGIDVSSRMIDIAKSRKCYDHLEVANVNQDVFKHFPNGLADVIICTGAMELLSTRHALGIFSRLLKTGGELWITFQARTEDSSSCSTAHQKVNGIDGNTMRLELNRHGFEIVNMTYHSDAFYTPSPELDGTLLPVPYFYVCGQKVNESFHDN